LNERKREKTYISIVEMEGRIERKDGRRRGDEEPSGSDSGTDLSGGSRNRSGQRRMRNSFARGPSRTMDSGLARGTKNDRRGVGRLVEFFLL
jgi:hypothetical protein